MTTRRIGKTKRAKPHKAGAKVRGWGGRWVATESIAVKGTPKRKTEPVRGWGGQWGGVEPTPVKSRPKQKVRSGKSYSKASKKGWITRRLNANPYPRVIQASLALIRKGDLPEGIDPRHVVEIGFDREIKRIEATGVKTFAHARIMALQGAALLNGKDVNDWAVLKSFAANEDPRWVYYLDLCDEAGLDMDDARDYWFSPEM